MTATAIAPARRVREVARVAVKTTSEAGHQHCAFFVSETGDGRTSQADDGHFHRVAAFEVLPARGHVHELSDRRCLRRHATETGNHIG
jgi:hypothetical protein